MQLTNIQPFHCFLFALSDKYLGSQKLKQFKPQECKLANWKSHVFLNIQLSLLLFSEIVQPRLFIHPPSVINKQTMPGKHGGHVPSTSYFSERTKRQTDSRGSNFYQCRHTIGAWSEGYEIKRTPLTFSRYSLCLHSISLIEVVSPLLI